MTTVGIDIPPGQKRSRHCGLVTIQVQLCFNPTCVSLWLKEPPRRYSSTCFFRGGGESSMLSKSAAVWGLCGTSSLAGFWKDKHRHKKMYYFIPFLFMDTLVIKKITWCWICDAFIFSLAYTSSLLLLLRWCRVRNREYCRNFSSSPWYCICLSLVLVSLFSHSLSFVLLILLCSASE